MASEFRGLRSDIPLLPWSFPGAVGMLVQIVYFQVLKGIVPVKCYRRGGPCEAGYSYFPERIPSPLPVCLNPAHPSMCTLATSSSFTMLTPICPLLFWRKFWKSYKLLPQHFLVRTPLLQRAWALPHSSSHLCSRAWRVWHSFLLSQCDCFDSPNSLLTPSREWMLPSLCS